MYHFTKRAFDLISSGIALLLLSPVFIPIMIALKLTGEGYVFYLQERVGHKNKLFHIYKFATMLKDSPNMKGGLITTQRDPRMTPLGPFLRKSKINELPQLLNIFLGHMSVVGPRPVMQKSFDQYPEDVQKVIYNSKPGLTGIGSIIFRDEEELITQVRDNGGDTWEFYKNKIYPYKGEVEKWYQQNASMYVDLLLPFITAWTIIRPKSDLLFKIFKDLPTKPDFLRE